MEEEMGGGRLGVQTSLDRVINPGSSGGVIGEQSIPGIRKGLCRDPEAASRFACLGNRSDTGKGEHRDEMRQGLQIGCGVQISIQVPFIAWGRVFSRGSGS